VDEIGGKRNKKNRWDPQIEEANTGSHCSKLQFRGLNFIGNPPDTLLQGVFRVHRCSQPKAKF
jgi:hypothetical protein